MLFIMQITIFELFVTLALFLLIHTLMICEEWFSQAVWKSLLNVWRWKPVYGNIKD